MEPTMLICARVTDQPHPCDGSIQISCEDCDEMVYVAKSGQALCRKEVEVLIVCIQCGFLRYLQDENPSLEVAPGAEAEIVDNFLRRVFP